MIERREFIVCLLGGLLFGKAAFAFNEGRVDVKKTLSRLAPYLIGLRKGDTAISAGDIDIELPRGMAEDLASLLARYQKKDVFDHETFISELESGKMRLSGQLGAFLLSVRNRAIISYYSTKEGWKTAGYDGPPLRGYPDYHACKKP